MKQPNLINRVVVLSRQYSKFHSENPNSVLDFNRDFWTKTSKSIFDFVKNIIVTASLSYAARKTDAYVLLFISAALGILLMVELISRLEAFFLRWITLPKSPKGLAIAASVVISLVSYIIIFGVIERFEASIK